MSQTDRQTDRTTISAIHWNSAIHDVGDNWAILKGALPTWIKMLKMKKEIAPTTGSEHFQIHVQCHTQQRMSKLCSWIKSTKWKAVKGEQYIKNSIDYVSKTETTAPGAVVEVREGEQYLRIHELLLQIARFAENPIPGRPEYEGDLRGVSLMKTNDWDNITTRMVAADLNWANKLSNPALRRMWETWKYVFIGRVEEWSSETQGAYIIEAPGHAVSTADNSDSEEVPPEVEEELESYAIE